MEAKLREKTEAFALEIAGQVTTLEELNGLMRSMMKSALEVMLDSEMAVHIGRKEFGRKKKKERERKKEKQKEKDRHYLGLRPT
jgi:hypothetical protein